MFASALAAETAFYAAFSNADVEQMMTVWARGCEVVCIHPSGPRLATLDEIRQSWALILQEQVLRRFELRGRLVLGDGEFCAHTVEENITVPGTSYVAPPVLATNIYQRLNDGWYMIMHHGSVAPAPLVERENLAESPAPRLLH